VLRIYCMLPTSKRMATPWRDDWDWADCRTRLQCMNLQLLFEKYCQSEIIFDHLRMHTQPIPWGGVIWGSLTVLCKASLVGEPASGRDSLSYRRRLGEVLRPCGRCGLRFFKWGNLKNGHIKGLSGNCQNQI
jgi:hypothetical protein